MSSRLTTPVSKLTRSFGTTTAVARPSHLLNNASKVATGAGRKTKPAVDEPSERQHSTTATSTTTPHRPVLPQHAQTRTIPFMQTFHHSAPKPAAPSFSTIDRAVLPDLFSLHADSGAAADPYAHIRVPLLPDNTSPGRPRQPEAADEPLPKPEILVVAANPEQVLPSALTEVEGMGVDGVELGFAHLLGREEANKESYEMGAGMIRDLWKGMVDDVLGSSSSQGKGGAAPAV
ncbi:hypothetical protein P885DRAFT_78488 [Corynascus similis CBS 632.67]